MNFIIQISFNGGLTWTTIGTGVTSLNNFFEYIVPNIETENALIKIINANNPSEFIISDVFNILNEISNTFTYELIKEPKKIYQEITYEIWKRILNNLPYIYKSKGTLRSLKSLITIYGIPESILQIREFGGPDVQSYNLNNIEEYNFESFGTALNFYGNQYIKLSWLNTNKYNLFPSCVQIRFSTKNNLVESQCLVSVAKYWSIILSRDYDNPKLGEIKFIINDSLILSSNKLPLYDDNPVLVTLQRSIASDADIDQEFHLYVKKYDGNSIISSHTFINVDSNYNNGWKIEENLYIGHLVDNYAIQNFSGSIDEFRLWKEPLYEYVIDTHTKFPQSIIGNNINSFYEDLLLRFDFNNPLPTNQLIENSAPSKEYDISNLEMIGWTPSFIFPFHYKFISYKSAARSLNIGLNRFTSNKVRIEKTKLVKNLSPFEFAEEGEFDFAPIDLNKIGIYFSPVDLINEDMIKKLAINSGDDLIGDPRDQYNDYYKQLNQLNYIFWNLTGFSNISLSDYFKFLKFYDFSLFEHLKNLVPARCFPIFGILYNPTLLQRNKIKKYKPKVEATKTGNEFINLIPRLLSDFILINIFFKNDNIYNIKSNFYNQLNSNINYNNYYNIKSNFYNQLNSNINYNNYYNIKSNIVNNNLNSNIEIKKYIYINSNNIKIYNNNVNALKNNLNGKVFLQINPNIDFENLYSNNFGLNLSFYQNINNFSSKHYYSNKCYETWERNLKYNGCKQTEYTTVDKKSPVEIWTSNPNKLISRDIEDLKLDVI